MLYVSDCVCDVCQSLFAFQYRFLKSEESKGENGLAAKPLIDSFEYSHQISDISICGKVWVYLSMHLTETVKEGMGRHL